MIQRELGWQPVPGSWPPGSVNCSLNQLAAWLSIRHYGFSHHHIEEAARVRLGELSRQEALALLRLDLDDPETRGAVSASLTRLGCTWADLGVA